MCRFLLAKSDAVLDTGRILGDFAHMAQKSQTPDGDRQADGWGVAWRVDGQWQEYKSLSPIWKERSALKKIPKCKYLAVHARSASFSGQKGNISYNQPYLNTHGCFVFNGSVAGVSFPRVIDGAIGAQKIHTLLLEAFGTHDPVEALSGVDADIELHSRRIVGLNIACIYNNELYALCDYTRFRDYFTVCYYYDKGLSIISSEPVGEFSYKTMRKKEVKRLQ